uniref:Uncharacterized protein n=1 Tax=Opuntia streptacantha TaxID=393608 RepID=A0A7C9E987_OPUST
MGTGVEMFERENISLSSDELIGCGQLPHIQSAPRLSIASDIIPPALTDEIFKGVLLFFSESSPRGRGESNSANLSILWGTDTFSPSNPSCPSINCQVSTNKATIQHT